MKISEQSIIFSNTQNQNHQSTSADFEQWLDTPTKQNSGDEFYWQHQDQLQQSQVTFESLPMAKQNAKPAISPETKISSNHLLPVPAETEQFPSIIESYQREPVTNSQESPLFLQELSTELQQLCSQLPIVENNNALIAKTPISIKSEEKRSIETRTVQSQLKNYHLYIQDDEVEMSLYTQDLDHQEQLELKNMIKLNLKHKGLSLKQLIINGVNNV